ncbi:PaaI family thioesterase [uncultured Ferrovibrio sp.]|jgi:acyl-coenzyme A thioesterase PaaI-like protein|uniref:PaaI family thioesterase n=1 Tax=uncultured Ferrovibrio sp. TaxID=1576913 RepID=UPI0026177062|nr:PaaI family thioesterase [uncultured Ferrovibrio sp.]
MTKLGLNEARAILAENFPPWIRELNLRFESIEPGRVVVRLPNNPKLARLGGILCGQAIMAVADTAMVFAVSSSLQKFTDMATVTQTTSFFRAVADIDVLCEARLLRLGRSLAFGEAVFRSVEREDPFAQASLTYALLVRK